MRVSIKRLLKKPGLWAFVTLFTLFLLFAGIFALGQSADVESQEPDTGIRLSESGEEDGEAGISEVDLGWMPPGPPRWFRSNAGGMALEETPSRLAAIRNEYALVIDYVDPADLDPFLAPFYKNTYSVEIRILFKKREESRKQWLFKDESGNTRFNAVFRVAVEEKKEVAEPEAVSKTEAAAETEAEESESDGTDIIADSDTDTADSPNDAVIADGVVTADGETAGTLSNTPADSATGDPQPPAPQPKGPVTIGFIEVYNDDLQISEDYRFTEDGEEIVIAYFYNEKMLIRAETRQRKQNAESADYQKMYTDEYRYNRSYFLRNVERFFHGQVEIEPVVLLFPGRVMEMARDKEFIKGKVAPIDFVEGLVVGEGYRIIYDTDHRGRILSQTMYDEDDEEVWVIKNTWAGERIVSILRIEGEDQKLTEYEYNSAGDRIVQRDIHNGVLERQVLTNGNKETEELFMNGVPVLRAYWENGRKISEERVRRR